MVFEICDYRKCTLVFLVAFVLYIDVLNVSMRFSIRFGTNEHIQGYDLKRCSKHAFLETTGMQHLFFCFVKLLLRPWNLSRSVELQKLMVNSREEMSVRVQKFGFMANLLLYSILGPNVISETLCNIIII